jgi:hypothetical protein
MAFEVKIFRTLALCALLSWPSGLFAQNIISLDSLGLSPLDLQVLKSPGIQHAMWMQPEPRSFFRLVRDGESVALYREGDYQILINDLETLENQSRSIHRGASYGSYPLIKENRLHLFSGYGMWRRNNNEIYFSNNTQEWEMKRASSLPPLQKFKFLTVYERGDSIYRLEWEPAGEYNHDEGVMWRIHKEHGDWELVGQIDSKNQMLSRPHFIELRDYLFALNDKDMLLIFDKKRQAVVQLIDDRIPETMRGLPETKLTISRGNNVEFWDEGECLLNINVADLARGATEAWTPVIEPISEKELREFWVDQIKSYSLGWILEPSSTALNSSSLPKRPTETAPSGGPKPFGYGSVIALTALISMALGWSAHSISRARSKVGKSPTAVNLQDMSSELRKLILHAGQILSLQEFDEMMGLADDQTPPETARARRSKLVKELVAESETILGTNILERKRNDSDARIIEYQILEVPQKS